MRTLVILAALVANGALVAAAQDNFERRLLAVPDTASTRLMTYDLTRMPHVAGTPAQAMTRDYVIDKLRAWGLEAWTKEYTVYIPHPDSVAAWVVASGGRASPLLLREPAVPEDPTSAGRQVPPFNGYSGDGDVTLFTGVDEGQRATIYRASAGAFSVAFWGMFALWVAY